MGLRGQLGEGEREVRAKRKAATGETRSRSEASQGEGAQVPLHACVGALTTVQAQVLGELNGRSAPCFWPHELLDTESFIPFSLTHPPPAQSKTHHSGMRI